MSRLLVTGGAGFIGANFIHYWLKNHPGERVIALDALTYAANIGNFSACMEDPDFDFVEGDINNQALVEHLLKSESLDTIVHFAAETHVDRSIANPAAFIEANVSGTNTLLTAARRVWLEGGVGVARPHRFHHVSTDEVYGELGPDEPAFTEKTLYSPSTPYAASKAASDHLVRAYHRTYGLDATISNCSNNYGPFQYPEKLIPRMLARARLGLDLTLHGDGSHVRDWLHVDDHCRGIERILDTAAAGASYNLGGRCERDNLSFVRTMCAVMDRLMPREDGRAHESSITFIDDRPGNDRRYAMDITKAASELGYQPHVSLETGLEATIRWYIDHPEWWPDVDRLVDKDLAAA